MINKIIGTIQTQPLESLLCVGAIGAFLGRRFCLAGASKIAAEIASLVGNEDLADKWEHISNTNLILAKKSVTRDLSALAGFITLGLISNYAMTLLSEEDQKKPGLFESYAIPVLSKVWNERRGPVLTVSGLGALGLTWKFRSPIFKSCRRELEDRNYGMKARLYNITNYNENTYPGEKCHITVMTEINKFFINLTTVQT